ncbi:MAG TPA: hypothetical protein PLX35_07975 [Cyclobacteriaceae bacterium]|nr:hypothetical protein [Cyclobacteriaceae bacterium]
MELKPTEKDALWVVISFVVTIVIIHLILSLLFWLRKKNTTDHVAINKIEQTSMIVHTIFGLGYLLIVSCGVTTTFNKEKDFLMNLASGIIITWLVAMVSYFAWAIYFYNINLGWSDEKWQRYRAKEAEVEGNQGPPPNENPYADQTFGLPPGTVRGTIAISLVVIAMALTIASISMDAAIRNDVTMVDHFDFLKKAFLMMIAFYFGSKSLEILQNSPTSPVDPTKQTNKQESPKPPDDKKPEQVQNEPKAVG